MKSSAHNNFRIGQQVFLPQLNAIAVIDGFDGKEVLFVKIGGDRIPVFVEDVSSEIPKAEEYEIKLESTFNYVENYSGMFLALLPTLNHNNDIESFNAVLVNATVHNFTLNAYVEFNTFERDFNKTLLQKQSVLE